MAELRARHEAELRILRDALLESEQTVQTLSQALGPVPAAVEAADRQPKRCRSEDDECQSTQGMPAMPWAPAFEHDSTQGMPALPWAPAPAFEHESTQGMPALPWTPAPACGNDSDLSMATQGLPAAPRVRLAPATRMGCQQVVRVSFTGVRDAGELQRYQSMVTTLGGELEAANTLSPQATHLVCFPDVGTKPSAKSIFAALSKKVLVSPGWLHASETQGGFVALRHEQAPGSTLSLRDKAGAPSSAGRAQTVAAAAGRAPHCSTDYGALVAEVEARVGRGGGSVGLAVQGVANPLDGKTVHLTDAFRAQHQRSKLVNELLTGRATLLTRAAQSANIQAAAFVFAADEEALGLQEANVRAIVLTWGSFVERYVPGHARRSSAVPLADARQSVLRSEARFEAGAQIR
jgi:hypothetical protein